jgi:hypothetical protein
MYEVCILNVTLWIFYYLFRPDKRSDLYHEICIFTTQKFAGNKVFLTLMDVLLYHKNSPLIFF